MNNLAKITHFLKKNVKYSLLILFLILTFVYFFYFKKNKEGLDVNTEINLEDALIAKINKDTKELLKKNALSSSDITRDINRIFQYIRSIGLINEETKQATVNNDINIIVDTLINENFFRGSILGEDADTNFGFNIIKMHIHNNIWDTWGYEDKDLKEFINILISMKSLTYSLLFYKLKELIKIEEDKVIEIEKKNGTISDEQDKRITAIFRLVGALAPPTTSCDNGICEDLRPQMFDWLIRKIGKNRIINSEINDSNLTGTNNYHNIIKHIIGTTDDSIITLYILNIQKLRETDGTDDVNFETKKQIIIENFITINLRDCINVIKIDYEKFDILKEGIIDITTLLPNEASEFDKADESANKWWVENVIDQMTDEGKALIETIEGEYEMKFLNIKNEGEEGLKSQITQTLINNKNWISGMVIDLDSKDTKNTTEGFDNQLMSEINKKTIEAITKILDEITPQDGKTQKRNASDFEAIGKRIICIFIEHFNKMIDTAGDGLDKKMNILAESYWTYHKTLWDWYNEDIEANVWATTRLYPDNKKEGVAAVKKMFLSDETVSKTQIDRAIKINISDRYENIMSALATDYGNTAASKYNLRIRFKKMVEKGLKEGDPVSYVEPRGVNKETGKRFGGTIVEGTLEEINYDDGDKCVIKHKDGTTKTIDCLLLPDQSEKLGYVFGSDAAAKNKYDGLKIIFRKLMKMPLDKIKTIYCDV